MVLSLRIKNPKGDALALFCKMILKETTPKTIVMVDDGMDKLTSCFNFCQKNNIEFFGIHHARTAYTQYGIEKFVEK